MTLSAQPLKKVDHQERLDYCLLAMKSQGADLASVTLEISEKHELNTEAHEVKLLRSNADAVLKLTFIKDTKKASTSVNKLANEAIDEAIGRLVVQAASAPEDSANDVSDVVDPSEQGACFLLGVEDPDLSGVFDLLDQFASQVKEQFPQVSGDAILSYDARKRFMANTKGVRLEEHVGNYNFQMLFAAKDGDKITSFNYTGSSLLNLDQNLMDIGMTGELLKQAIAELEAKPLKAKFVGDVVIAPLCVSDFLGMIKGIALEDGPLISGTSVLKDKVGEVIASPQLSWYSKPRHSELAGSYALTTDGFVAKDVTILENGVLKSHLLTQYGAKKTGRERAGSYGVTMVVEGGKTPLSELIKGVKRGILLSRFSGGSPGANGEFAGVAKNSFYIEDGEIKFPITETMVSGNLFETLNHIEAISQERVNFGSELMPWIHAKGVTISG